jgi:simple sugar transport system permease protein
VWLLGESPSLVFQVILKSAFGSLEDFGMTLFYMTPLLFTGLSVAIAFHAGLFNVGAEGQLLMGAIAGAWVGIKFPIETPWIAHLVGLLACILGGALWGFIPGFLKVKRGSHEVINTILLNFVASGLSSWITLYFLKSTDSQSPETMKVQDAYLLHPFSFFGDTPLNVSFVLAVCLAFGVWFFLYRTVSGYRHRAVGENPKAAQFYQIRPSRVQLMALMCSGAIAGLVGFNEVYGNSGRFKMGFSPDFGFMGIAVALLARAHPIGILGSSLLFAALHKGSSDLDLETEKITRDFSLVLQAVIILMVSSPYLLDLFKSRMRIFFKPKAEVNS